MLIKFMQKNFFWKNYPCKSKHEYFKNEKNFKNLNFNFYLIIPDLIILLKIFEDPLIIFFVRERILLFFLIKINKS